MADRPNWLLTGSAVLYFAASVSAIFAGDELLDMAGAVGTPLELALLQLLGAAVFSLSSPWRSAPGCFCQRER